MALLERRGIFMDLKNIRNFCIIAHIDHGKSTLADRMMEITGTVQKRDMKSQLLDSMELEREKGITIKLAPVTMNWKDIEKNKGDRISCNEKGNLEVKDFFEDNLVIIGRRKIDNLSQMLTSSIAIPNYKTNIGKTGLDILAKVEGFQEMAKKIQYKDDVMSALESVDLYEVDYAFVTKKILPLAKNSETCYIFPDNMGRSKILYKAYINLESKKNPKKFYDFIEEDLADKTILKPNPEKNKVIKTN